ncbi:hypothetical protein C4K08_3004 [Pseudomonas chlororaphis subsp. aureofaciens]|nr:hypothetical protein C4K08_3004 [Pseudomonas chlororaphis subsp. aureofaciens]
MSAFFLLRKQDKCPLLKHPPLRKAANSKGFSLPFSHLLKR